MRGLFFTAGRRQRIVSCPGMEIAMELCMEHLSKHFKDLTAVDDVSLQITPGVWGLLGANGA